MAREFNEIQQSVLDARAAASELSALEVLTTQEQTLTGADSTSKVAVWRLWVWIISFVIWLHEKIVEANAENSRPHNIPWYKEQCLNFHDGLPLVWKDGQFKYDLTGVSDAEERKIIDRVAVLESNDGELVIKIATDNAGSIEPVTAPQLVRFTAYMQQIKDAGNQLRIINQTPDLLKITLTVYVDPLVIDLVTGKLLTVAEEVYPVKQAVDDYLANLEFNGAFVREFLRDKMQSASGVKLPIINDVQWKYSTFPFASINQWKVPEAGYFKIETGDLVINYEAYDLANA